MNGIKPDPDVKMEGDGITPSGSGYMDDDFYEDTGELALPQKGQEKDVWITRIPKYLYEAISKFDDMAEGRDDDQIVIGEVLAMRDQKRPGGLSKTDPMRLFFNTRPVAERKLPQAFELQMTPAPADVLANTYVFTEKDLPGFKPTGYGHRGMGGMGNSFGSNQGPKGGVQKRSKYRKAIPKQTALVGNATREYTANPLPTKEHIEFSKARIRTAIQGKQTHTNISTDLNDHTVGLQTQKMFKDFIRPATAPRTQLNKAARIPKNELIDMLHAAFDEYKYWSMKSLKMRTKQPEAYLKETLSEIGQLVKGGPFASNWMRQAIYDRDLSAQLQDVAPEEEGDDDEEVEMEDVI